MSVIPFRGTTRIALEAYLEERLTSLPNLLARLLVDVLLANVRAPLLDDLLLEDVRLVELHEDLGNGGDEVGMVDADEAFNAAQQRLLMLLRCHNLRRTRQQAAQNRQ